MTTLTMHLARKRLAVVWFAGAFVCFFVLLVISFFAENVDPTSLWDWFLPAVVPNLSLIIGVLVYAHRQTQSDTPIDPFLYRLALSLSLLYLALLVLPLLFFPLTGKPLPELLNISRLWLAAVQGLATGVMGAFFVRHDK
ncbi:MAG: hypothetical protein B7Y26_10055 [Hydrogenophilales bacterium 16-64-46]|nr:MAG: hypothetical protein B7Z32_05885 [Hydrogenophilales bacterium 12-64-13]OYZ04960.1 MAG: hypothetical protein B7Y26_10055 [Hydrogenophilales bacterium 16-64-46]OZA37604.1 MAG: hypothetical protein B7X87_10775 [Hydrogenophilales bacterium 17-64-34]HQT00874.1 hypothetical protein [Thiobacillus sp.]